MRYFVTDLDGTFLNRDGTVPVSCARFLDFLRSRGYEIIYATARPASDAIRLLESNDVLPKWLVANDGAFIYSMESGVGNEVLMEERLLDNDVYLANLNFMAHQGCSPVVFSGSKFDFDAFVPVGASECCIGAIKKSDPSRGVRFYQGGISDLVEIDSVRSISMLGDVNPSVANLFRVFNSGKANVMYYPETRFYAGMWLDIIALNAEKYCASMKLIESGGGAGIDIALGNGDNDIGIMCNSAYSMAPITSNESVKAVASYVSNFEEGEPFLLDVMSKIMRWV